MQPNRIVPLVVVALAAGAAPVLAAGTTERVSVDSAGQQGDSVSFSPSLSGDGRLVAFQSVAGNLVANDTNGAGLDVFVHDRQAGTTVLASVSLSGGTGNRDAFLDGTYISRNGRYVVFGSDASDLVPNDTNGDTDVFVRVPAPSR
jgi:Tol biopolymer transport system component